MLKGLFKKILHFIGATILGAILLFILLLIYALIGVFFTQTQQLDKAYFWAYVLPMHGLLFNFEILFSWVLGWFLVPPTISYIRRLRKEN